LWPGFLMRARTHIDHPVAGCFFQVVAALGVDTVGDLATLPASLLSQFGGVIAPLLLRLAAGEDNAAVRERGPAKSILVEKSFPPVSRCAWHVPPLACLVGPAMGCCWQLTRRAVTYMCATGVRSVGRCVSAGNPKPLLGGVFLLTTLNPGWAVALQLCRRERCPRAVGGQLVAAHGPGQLGAPPPAQQGQPELAPGLRGSVQPVVCYASGCDAGAEAVAAPRQEAFTQWHAWHIRQQCEFTWGSGPPDPRPLHRSRRTTAATPQRRQLTRPGTKRGAPL